MTNDKNAFEKPGNNANSEISESTEQGREQPPADKTENTDISHVDQQEGAMQNGALGGNFETAPEVSKK